MPFERPGGLPVLSVHKFDECNRCQFWQTHLVGEVEDQQGGWFEIAVVVDCWKEDGWRFKE